VEEGKPAGGIPESDRHIPALVQALVVRLVSAAIRVTVLTGLMGYIRRGTVLPRIGMKFATSANQAGWIGVKVYCFRSMNSIAA
jgi:hypothetical protein